MWAIDNRTPYKVGKTWGRDKDGVHEWIVCVKASYGVTTDGHLALADEQLEPLRLPEYHGEPGTSSLRYDADLVAPKPTTDVLLNGSAYAPGNRPNPDFTVALTVGSIHKVLRVQSHRRSSEAQRGASSSAFEPMTRIPITYERAYGGYDHADADPRNHRMDPRNPVGCGAVARPSRSDDQALPNFEYPHASPEKAGPAGFGAIDSFWSPRREFAGTYDRAWEQNRRPLLPFDWDPRSLLCAPVDQQPQTFLRGGELVELVNLTPSGLMRFALPRIHLSFSTYIDARVEEHRGRLSTVIIEPDYPRVIMVWLTSLSCRSDVDYLDVTVVREKPFIR